MNDINIETGHDFTAEEIHLIVGDIVEESVATQTKYDFETEIAETLTVFTYVGPELPKVEARWNNDPWFRSEGWFESEAW